MSRAKSLATLEPILEVARTRGFLGPGPVVAHIDHALGFSEVVESRFDPPASVLDLGTGGGVPGLVLAACWPGARICLVEAMSKRAAFLQDAITKMGWSERVELLDQRAEEIARIPEVRESSDVVTARSFAGPAATVEIASALVRVGGVVVVSEPPVRLPSRWPEEKLAQLGLSPPTMQDIKAAHFSMFSKLQPSRQEVPRGVGRPTKRPLW